MADTFQRDSGSRDEAHRDAAPEEAGALDRARQTAQAETTSRPVRHWRALAFQGYVLFALLIFSMLALLARTSPTTSIDILITRALQEDNLGWLSLLMRLVSWPGYGPQGAVIMGVVFVALFVLGLRWEAVMALASGLGADLLNLVVKLAIQRPRPSADLVNVFQQLKDFSFPSGHVMFYTGFFGFLWFLSYTLLKHSWRRTLLLILFGGLVALVGLSRVYLGEHWTSDVLAAYLLSSLTLLLAIAAYRWGKPRFFVHQPVAPEKKD